MDLNSIGKFITDIGFPVFIAAVLLLYIDKKLDKLTEVISELSLVIKTCLTYSPRVRLQRKRRFF